MTTSVDQSDQTLKPSPTPIVNPEVQSIVDNGELELELLGERFKCDSNQALVWALCSPCIDTLHQVAYQLETLAEYNREADTLAYVTETVSMFEQRQFLSLAANEQVEYPFELSMYSHFMSSRGGVYAFNRKEFKRLAHGMFYGLATDESGNLLAMDFPHLASPEWNMSFARATGITKKTNGLIRQFNITNGILNSEDVRHEGIGNNCHQMVLHNGYLYLVDTANQLITEISPTGVFRSIFPKRSGAGLHLNSLARRDNGWLLMQSSTSRRDLRSFILVLNEGWERVEEIPLSALRAHDVLIEEIATSDGQLLDSEKKQADKVGFWYCRSSNNQIAHYPSGTTIRLEKPHFDTNNKVRGLSDTDHEWLIGHGRVRHYKHHSHTPPRASIAFVDKVSHKQTDQIQVPELPCCIVRNPWYQNP